MKEATLRGASWEPVISIWMMLLCGLSTGCATGSTNYQSTSQVDKTSAGMSDTDVRLLTSEIVADLLTTPALEGYEKPVTISLVGITNSTSEFINTDALYGQEILAALIRNGAGRFEVVDRTMLDETIREASLAADGLISQAEATQIGRAAGVRLLMTGDITSLRNATTRRDTRFYKLGLRLVDTERNTIVWIHDAEVRKSSSKGWMQ